MAAPYRANHQHKVKAHTSEASKMSVERALIGTSLLSGCRKAIEELQKSIAKRCRSGILCTAFVAKNVLAFWRRSLFLFK